MQSNQKLRKKLTFKDGAVKIEWRTETKRVNIFMKFGINCFL